MIFPKKDFNKISCKEAYVDKHFLIDMFQKMKEETMNIHQMMLLHQGSLVFDMSLEGHDEKKENVYSVSKSFTSVAIGIFIARGKLSLDDYLLPLFPDELKKYIPEYESLQLKHLLTMTSGQVSDRFHGLTPQHNPVEIYFNTELKYEMGTHFSYSNFDSFMLSIIVTKITGLTLNAFLEEELYKKIGLENIEWPEFAGYSLGCTGLRLSVQDMSRFGLLLLNDGVWDGEQIVSKSYLDLATSVQVNTDSEKIKLNKHGYGYQFWINGFGDYKAAGLYNQLIIINKAYDLVFSVIAYEERPLTELFRDYILEGFISGWKPTHLSLKDEIKQYKKLSNDLLQEEEKTRKY